MSGKDIPTLQQADQARTTFGHSNFPLNRAQRFKLRVFLGLAKVLRWCRLL
jgi:hypothetical protein